MANTISNIAKWTPEKTRRNNRLLGCAMVLVILLVLGLLIVDQARRSNRMAVAALADYQATLDHTGSLLREMEANELAYGMGGQAPAATQYRQAEIEVAPLLDTLRTRAVMVGPNAPQRIENFIEAVRTWQVAAGKIVDSRGQSNSAPSEPDFAAERNAFDAIKAREQSSQELIRERFDLLNQRFNLLYPVALTLLTALAVLGVATVIYCSSLLKRLGESAALLQVRQDRVQAYATTVTTLNGATELEPLLAKALPSIVATAGGQAGVVYLLEGGLLRPRGGIGLDMTRLGPLRLDEGLPGAALQQDRLIAVKEVSADLPFRIATGVGEALPHDIFNLPLRFGQELLGVLTVASINSISDAAVQSLQLAAPQLATAMSNVRAFEAMAKQREELRVSNAEIARRLAENETLQDMGRELAKQRDLQPLLQLVCRAARHLLQADLTAVATEIDRDGATKWVAAEGLNTDMATKTVFPPHSGTAGRVLDGGQPVVIGAPDTPELQAEFPVFVAEGVQGALGVPLFRKDQPVGALIVAYRRPQEITSEMIDLSTALAAYASVAIENARLLSELANERDLVKARARELEDKNREVERANRLKTEFVANMSHELRTPLNSILALSQILDDELDGPINDEQRKQVQIIERNGHNLLRLINDILDLSKIEAGKLELLPASFTAAELIEGVRTVVAPLIVDKRLNLVTELAPDLPPLHSDENKLKQVLLNLLSNAVKFTPEGTVTIRVRPGRSVGDQPGPSPWTQWLTFEVADTGIGIATQDLPSIWDEFQQIDGSLSRKFEGTGLGLAIVRRLVDLLGGAITATSMVGAGSTFTFSIPAQLAGGPRVIALNPPPTAAQEDSHEQLRTPGKPVVLVVDDDPEVIYILQKYLRDDGYEIEVATTGDEAIAKARKHRPFAMTLDVMLPGRDGWEVIQALKADPRTAHIPIIMLSMLDNRQLGYSLGTTDYLVKPISRTDLLERLHRLRNGKPLRSVLVVDDDPIEQRVLGNALREGGMDVTSVDSGAAALQWLDQHTPDLITLDLMMPGMDGFTVLETIKQRPALKEVPVFIITAKEITSDDRLRLNSRIAAIIQKGPRERDELLGEVRDRLRYHRARLQAHAEVEHE